MSSRRESKKARKNKVWEHATQNSGGGVHEKTVPRCALTSIIYTDLFFPYYLHDRLHQPKRTACSNQRSLIVVVCLYCSIMKRKKEKTIKKTVSSDACLCFNVINPPTVTDFIPDFSHPFLQRTKCANTYDVFRGRCH